MEFLQVPAQELLSGLNPSPPGIDRLYSGVITTLPVAGVGGIRTTSVPKRDGDCDAEKRGMYDQWLLRDLDGDGDLDAIGTRSNSAPYYGVVWLEQVR